MFNNQKISIIGCGWLGFPLAKFLLEKGFEVKGSTTSEDKLPLLKEAGIIPFFIKAGEELEGEKLEDFFDSEILIINIPPRRRRPDVERLHFLEIKNILDAAQKGSVQKIIFCSSTGVYSDVNKEVSEADMPSPSTDSTKALFKIENHLQSSSDFKNTILRFSGLVGGERKAGRFLAGRQHVANGNAPVNLVHREDCIQVIYEIIRQDIWNEIFNVCSDKHPLRKDFYTKQTIKQGLVPPSFLENEEPRFKIVSNEKLKKELGYTFIHPDPSEF